MKWSRAIVLILLSFFFHGFYAQEASLWEGHFSYLDIKDVSKDGDIIYVAAENAIFTYNSLTMEMDKISTVDGLSGEIISNIHYSTEYNLLIIGYDNGLMDILDSNREVLTVIDIINKPTIPPTQKRINHFNEQGGVVYISTDYGISVYNLVALEFGDTYFIGNGGSQIPVYQTAVFNGEIYAACGNGNAIKRAAIDNPNLIDYQQWQTINSGSFLGIESLNDQLYAIKSNNVIYEIGGGTFNALFTYPNTPVDLRRAGNILMVTTSAKVYVYDENFNGLTSANTTAEFPTQFTCAISNGQDELFVGTQGILTTGKPGYGILKSSFSQPNSFTEIHPAGPLLNDIFSIEASANQLWAVFGGYSVSFNFNGGKARTGISHYKNEEWINTPFDTVAAAVPGPFYLSHIAINPFDPSKVFISSHYSGLIEIIDDEPITLYDTSNSTLHPFTSNFYLTSVPGIDDAGTLWQMNARVADPLNRFKDGNWNSYDFTSIIETPNDNKGFSSIEFAPNGTIFIGSSGFGLIGFRENNGSPDLKSISSEDEGFPTVYVKSLALDNNNQLWIGTLRGLRVLFNTSNFFDDPNVSVNQIVFLDDGIPKELLSDQVISDIEVDGSNNKWVATGTSGVFYFSPDGQETIYHFTKDNSPLPSDIVNDIAIDPSDGTVYIATQNGLVAFSSGGTTPGKTLEDAFVYPNPVRPDYNILGSNDLNNINNGVKIQGLTENVNIKITDIEGNLVAEAQSRINLRSSKANYNFAIDGGTAIWNGKNLGNNVVATGVYLIMISDLDSFETKILKLLIVR